MFSNFDRVCLYNETRLAWARLQWTSSFRSVAWANLRWLNSQTRIEIRTSPDRFRYPYRKCTFVDFVFGCMGLLDCVHYQEWSSWWILKCVVQCYLLDMWLYGVCALILTYTTHQSNMEIRLLRKVTLVAPAYPYSYPECFHLQHTASHKVFVHRLHHHPTMVC